LTKLCTIVRMGVFIWLTVYVRSFRWVCRWRLQVETPLHHQMWDS